MGKRSDFARRERDFYPTPPEAVDPLLPHLKLNTHFIEPCAGDGALIDALVAAGHTCVHAADIEPQRSDIQVAPWQATPVIAGAVIVTNPPWRRDILHPMICELSRRARLWLLFDADWSHTRQASEYLSICSKIVSVGRVRWFGNMTGKDNAAWHCFDRQHDGPVQFYGRQNKSGQLSLTALM